MTMPRHSAVLRSSARSVQMGTVSVRAAQAPTWTATVMYVLEVFENLEIFLDDPADSLDRWCQKHFAFLPPDHSQGRILQRSPNPDGLCTRLSTASTAPTGLSSAGLQPVLPDLALTHRLA